MADHLLDPVGVAAVSEPAVGHESADPLHFPHERLLLLLVLLITFALYAGTLNFQFVYDDWPQIVRNPFLASGAQVVKYFTSSVWSHVFGKTGNFYRPIFMSWLALNRWCFGLNPMGWHLTTVLLHVIDTYLVYVLARRLFRDGLLAVFAAAIFGVHAVHVESVAWISGVTDPLVAVFMLTSFLCFLNYEQRRVRMCLAASLLLYGLALLSKEVAIVLPAIIVVYVAKQARAQKADAVRPLLVPVLTFAAATALYLVARRMALSGFAQNDGQPLRYVLQVMPYAIVKYMGALGAPVRLAVFHDPPDISGFASLKFILPVLLIALVSYCVWRIARVSTASAVTMAWLVLPLVPALVGVALLEREEFVHDRYLYLPSVGFALLLAGSLRRWATGRRLIFHIPLMQVAVMLALVTFYGSAAAWQMAPWASNLLLYTQGVKQTSRSAIARDHLGTELLAKGDSTNAFHYFEEAWRIDPHDWRTSFSLGVASYYAHRLPEAVHYLTAASELEPQNSNQYYFRGLSRMEMGQLDVAEADLRKAIAITNSSPDYYRALGGLLERKGDQPAAVQQYEMALKLAPDDALSVHVRELRKEP